MTSLTLHHRHTHIPSTPTHKPVTSPQTPPPMFSPLHSNNDWGGWGVYRNLPALSSLLSFLPSIHFCTAACLAVSLTTLGISHLSPPFPALQPSHPFEIVNRMSFERLRHQTGWLCLTHEWVSHTHTCSHGAYHSLPGYFRSKEHHIVWFWVSHDLVSMTST